MPAILLAKTFVLYLTFRIIYLLLNSVKCLSNLSTSTISAPTPSLTLSLLCLYYTPYIFICQVPPKILLKSLEK